MQNDPQPGPLNSPMLDRLRRTKQAKIHLDNSIIINHNNNQMDKNKCIYCGDTIPNEEEKHFVSDCCGRGMCENCYQGLQGTEEQLQVDGVDDQEDFDNIKKEYQNADYLCFDEECCKKWRVKA